MIWRPKTTYSTREFENSESAQDALTSDLRAMTDGHNALCEEMLRTERERKLSHERAQSLENALATLTEADNSLQRELADTRLHLDAAKIKPPCERGISGTRGRTRSSDRADF